MTVAATHMLERLSPAFQELRFTWFDPGSFGVTIFFLCSGFIIPRSLDHAGAVGSSLLRFWIKRFMRLYPAYWLSVLLIAACYSAGVVLTPQGVTLDRGHILTQMTMLQSFVSEPHFLVVYWTLTFEIVFYVAVSVLFAARVLAYIAPLAIGMTLASAILEIGVLPALGLSVAPGLLSFLTLMFSGTVFYHWQAGKLGRSTAIGIILFNMLVLCVVAWSAGVAVGEPWLIFFQASAWSAGFAAFLIVFVWQPKPIPAPLLWLGKISYSIYLLHPIVIALVPGWLGLPGTLLIWSAALIPTAALSYYLIERPGMMIGDWLTTQIGRTTHAKRGVS